MNLRISIFLAGFLGMSLLHGADAPVAAAQPTGVPVATPAAAASPAATASSDETAGDLFVIERYLNMQPERLKRMCEMLHRIERMTPAERKATLERLKAVRKEVMDMAADAKVANPGERMLIHNSIARLNAEQRRKLREQLASMPPEKQQELFVQMVAQAKAQMPKRGQGGMDCPDASPDAGQQGRGKVRGEGRGEGRNEGRNEGRGKGRAQGRGDGQGEGENCTPGDDPDRVPPPPPPPPPPQVEREDA